LEQFNKQAYCLIYLVSARFRPTYMKEKTEKDSHSGLEQLAKEAFGLRLGLIAM
jgi:hypothetical protein